MWGGAGGFPGSLGLVCACQCNRLCLCVCVFVCTSARPQTPPPTHSKRIKIAQATKRSIPCYMSEIRRANLYCLCVVCVCVCTSVSGEQRCRHCRHRTTKQQRIPYQLRIEVAGAAHRIGRKTRLLSPTLLHATTTTNNKTLASSFRFHNPSRNVVYVQFGSPRA